ncbi:MAG: hypothetical protein R2726_18775 [Acidimicrobiales bacterium]
MSRGGLDVTYGHRDDGKLGRITSPLGIDNFGYDDGAFELDERPIWDSGEDYDANGRPARLNEWLWLQGLPTTTSAGSYLWSTHAKVRIRVRTDYSYDDPDADRHDPRRRPHRHPV